MSESLIWWAFIAAGGVAAAALGSFLTFEAYIAIMAVLLLATLAALAWTLHLKAHLLGFAALLVTALILPIEFSNHWNSSFLIAGFVVGVGAITPLLSLSRKTTGLPRLRAVYAALGLMFVASVSFLSGQFQWFASPGAPIGAQTGQLALFLLSAGLFLVVGHQLRNEGELRRLTWLFVIAGGFVCVLEVLPGAGILFKWTQPPSIGSLFWIWLVAVSLSQAVWNRSLTPAVRTLLILVTILCLFRGLVLNFSWASGWLPPLVAAGIILGLRFPRLAVSCAFLALPVGVVLSSLLWQGLMINEEYSWVTRLEASRVLLRLAASNPILGLGPANYYHYAELSPIMGWYVPFSSHNNYVDLIMQTGFLGLLIFGWLVFEVAYLSWRLHIRAPYGFGGAYSVGALGGIAASLVAGALGDWIIPFVYNVGVRGFRSSLLFWVFLGGVLALARMSKDRT